jgi:hypothetical protein
MKRVAPLLIAILAALLVACGGSDDGSGSGAAAGPTSTPRPAATATPEPACSTADGERVYDLPSDVSDRWDDAVTLADSTPRMQLAGQIETLQAIRRDLSDQDWPACAERAQSAMRDAMDAAIDAFIAFLGQEPDSTVNAFMADYEDALARFADELAKLR